jgi:hypothetical protein
VPHRTTYYSEEELEAIEALEDEHDNSFSGVVREAVRNYWGIEA